MLSDAFSEGCSESNASHCMVLAHDVRGGRWWCAGDVGVEPSHQCSMTCYCRVTDGSRGAVWHSGSDVEVHMKQRCVTELLHVDTMSPTDIHGHTRSIGEDQAVDVSTVRLWAVATATIGHLRCCRLLQARYAGSTSSLVKRHSSWWGQFCG